MKTILHTVDFKSPPPAVFNALTTEQGLREWWTTSVNAEIKLGGIVNFTFLESFNPNMKIVSLDKPGLLEWKCVGGHEPWMGNTFHFGIESRGTGSILFFRQEYTKELHYEEYGRYNYNWGYYLESLRLLVETGKGTPYQVT